MTVLENLQMGAVLGEESNFAVDLKRMYTLFPILEERCTQSAGTLSGGEQQMLAIARALMSRPQLLLLDEPLISLDQHQQHVIVTLVRRLSKEFGLTVLFSAHELNQLLGAIDQVLYLGGGTAVLGTVDEVVNPETLSRLYGTPIDVIRSKGRIFVMSGGEHIERDHHDHAHL